MLLIDSSVISNNDEVFNLLYACSYMCCLNFAKRLSCESSKPFEVINYLK